MPPEGPSSPPQFALRDALIFVLMTGVWMWLFGRLGAARTIEERVANPHGAQAGASLVAILVSVGFAALSLGLSHAHRRSASERTFALVLALVVGPALILAFTAFVVRKTSAHTRGDVAYNTLRELHLAQQTYFAANGEYAPGVVALGSLSPISHYLEAQRRSRPGETAAARSAGYEFRVLHAQGPHGPGGRKSFFTPGPDGRERLTEGFALVALPDDKSTGIAIVVVTDAAVYAKRVGPDPATILSEMTEFDPDPTWTRVER